MKKRITKNYLNRLEPELMRELATSFPFLERFRKQVAVEMGKNKRAEITFLLGHILQAPPSALVDIAVAVEIIHLATLIHDDVIDGGSLRRNRPSLQVRQGIPPAILYGDLLFSRGISRVNRLGRRELTELLLKTVEDLCAGEILECQLARRFPWTENEYLEAADLKTASLFRYCCRAPGMLAGLSRRRLAVLDDFGSNLGICYQIVDDCLDFVSIAKEIGKDTLADLKNGVPNLPLVLAGRKRGLTGELKRVINEASKGKVPDRLERMIREKGFVREALDRARNYLDSARRKGTEISGWIKGLSPTLLEEYLAGRYGEIDRLDAQ